MRLKWFLTGVVVIFLITGCGGSRSAQDSMFAGKNEKSAWNKRKAGKKKKEDFNPVLRSKTKPSQMQARENKRTERKAKRAIRKEKRRLRRAGKLSKT